MARQSAGFVHEHIEKVVIGVTALALGGCVYYAFMSGRFRVNDQDARALVQSLDDASQRVVNAVRTAKLPPDKGPSPQEDPALKQLDLWFGKSSPGLPAIAAVAAALPRTQPFPPLLVSTTEVAPEDRHNLAMMVTPYVPVVSAGRSTLMLPPNPVTLDKWSGDTKTPSDAVESERSWVSVAAQIDLIAQEINFSTERYPRGSRLPIVKVHLQRMDVEQPWRGWEDIETYLPFKMPALSDVTDATTGGFQSSFISQINMHQEAIARPPMPERKSGDRIVPPPVPYYPDPPKGDSVDPDRRVREFRSLAEKALDGRSPFSGKDLDAALVMARAAAGVNGAKEKDLARVNELLDTIVKGLKKQRKKLAKEPLRAPEKLMPIVAHDLTAVPGRTYVYRMRYEVYNVFVGATGELLNPDDARRLTILSDWSPESRPVQIEGDTLFYLTKDDRKKSEVTVTVYKKNRSGWQEAEFKVKVGDSIGGRSKTGGRADFSTGAVCIDIDFGRKNGNKDDVALVYVDTATGMLHERLLSADQSDRIRKTLARK